VEGAALSNPCSDSPYLSAQALVSVLPTEQVQRMATPLFKLPFKTAVK